MKLDAYDIAMRMFAAVGAGIAFGYWQNSIHAGGFIFNILLYHTIDRMQK